MSKPNEEQIRERAHQLWEVAGRPEGREQDFWLEAERELAQSDRNTDEASSGFTE